MKLNSIFRPKVAIFCDYYLPGFRAGGPVKSISGIVSSLGSEFNFKVITRDRDKQAAHPYVGITVDEWNRVGDADVYYVGRGLLSYLKMLRLIQSSQWNFAYFNSLLSIQFSFLPLLALFNTTRTIVAPRGELEDGALAVKPLKKRIFLWFVKLLKIYNNSFWHATSVHEVKAISSRMDISSNFIRLAPNLFNIGSRSSASDLDDNGLRLVYVSRITPKKNLLAALVALEDIEVPYAFNIYGPVDDADYWDQCKELIEKFSGNKISWMGEITPEQVSTVFRQSDLLVFPTHGENFGHVIVEALSNSCPVLISDMTPWTTVQEFEAGYVVQANDVEAIRASITRHFTVGKQQRLRMRQSAIKYIKEFFDTNDLVEQHRLLFKWDETLPPKRGISRLI